MSDEYVSGWEGKETLFLLEFPFRTVARDVGTDKLDKPCHFSKHAF